jgi:hypothetical protein
MSKTRIIIVEFEGGADSERTFLETLRELLASTTSTNARAGVIGPDVNAPPIRAAVEEHLASPASSPLPPPQTPPVIVRLKGDPKPEVIEPPRAIRKEHLPAPASIPPAAFSFLDDEKPVSKLEEQKSVGERFVEYLREHGPSRTYDIAAHVYGDKTKESLRKIGFHTWYLQQKGRIERVSYGMYRLPSGGGGRS